MKQSEAEFFIQSQGIYKIVYRPPHSGLKYELYEIWMGDKFARHATDLEIAFFKAGIQQGKKGS